MRTLSVEEARRFVEPSVELEEEDDERPVSDVPKKSEPWVEAWLRSRACCCPCPELPLERSAKAFEAE